MSNTDHQISEIIKPLRSALSIMNAIALSLVFAGTVIILGALSLAISCIKGPVVEGVTYLKSLVYEPLFGILVVVAGVLIIRSMKKVDSATKDNDPVDARSAMRYLAVGSVLLAVAILLVSLFLFTEAWYLRCLSA